jgi:hypothetical protein
VSAHQLMGSLMFVFGAMLAGGSAFGWEWFVSGRKYRRLAQLHPLVPRILYGIVGLVLMVFGVLQLLGRWQGGWDGRG